MMSSRAFLTLVLFCIFSTAFAQSGIDLLIAVEETKVLDEGLYEFRSIKIANRGKLVLKGGVTIATETFSADDGATIELQSNTTNQKTISINTLDASGLKFLYINANGKKGADQTGSAPPGPNGNNARPTGGSLRYPNGSPSTRGTMGNTGASGENGLPAANVNLHLPNIKIGSLIRIHAIGGSGGKGQQGGQGGRGGEGAFGHPAAQGGLGGPGGSGGAAGDAGKIVVYLVVSDDATEQDRDTALKTLRLEYANSAGTPGEGGPGGLGGPGGSGAPGGGDGRGGASGSLGAGGGQGAIGLGPSTRPDQRWVVTDIITQSQYALQYTQNLLKIRAAMDKR